MDLLYNLLDTCTTLTKRVENLEQDKIAQALEITKLKQRVKKLERRNKLRGRIIISMVVDVDVTLKDVVEIAKEVAVDAEIEESADVQGRQAKSQVEIYQIDLEHSEKVLSMQDDEVEPVEAQEVVEVVTTAKLIIEVVTVASAIITAAAPTLTTVAAPTLIVAAASTLTTAPSAASRRKGVVIRDPKETATPSTIIHTEAKSKDKRKGILVEESKPLKKQAQIKQDEAFNTKEQMEEEDSKALKRISESQEDKAAKKQKLDEEVVELKRHLQIVPNDEDNVYTKATPLARKVPVVDYTIHTENNKPYFKIIRADGTH
nr:hypothetical protein [Tanacetum cinerariifolium]